MSKTKRTFTVLISAFFAFLLLSQLFTINVIADGNGTGSSAQVGNDLTVHFINAGQGDATVIELPDGRKMLIDASDNGEEEIVLDYLTTYIFDTTDNVDDYFDIVMLTHSDADHCGGLKEVLEQFPAKVFYRPNILASREEFDDPGEDDLIGFYGEHSTKSYADAIAKAYAQFEINGQTITPQVIVSDATNETTSVIKPNLDVTHPNYYEIVLYSPIGNDYGDVNDFSPIMILSYHEKRFALSGDAEEEAEEEFVQKAKQRQGKYAIFDESFSVDVIKLGHHGSSTSSSEEYLDVMSTSASRAGICAIASCGEGNSYQHPHTEVINRLKDMGFKQENILVTFQDGDIVFNVKGKIADDGTVSYSLMRGEAEVIVPQGSDKKDKNFFEKLFGFLSACSK